jgi:hypothetical protein
MTTRSYSRAVTASGMSIFAGRRRGASAGIIVTISRNGCGMGNSLNRPA